MKATMTLLARCHKKSLKIPKEYSNTVNRGTENTIAKRNLDRKLTIEVAHSFLYSF